MGRGFDFKGVPMKSGFPPRKGEPGGLLLGDPPSFQQRKEERVGEGGSEVRDPYGKSVRAYLGLGVGVGGGGVRGQ